MKLSIIGGGSWGLALSKVLADNEHDVLVYDINEKIVSKINDLHICVQLNEYIPESVKATTSIKEAMDFSDILLFVVPTKVLRIALKSAIPYMHEEKLFINAAKGIEPESFKRISEIILEMVPKEKYKGFVSLSGPSHAEEVIKGMPTLITSASENIEHAKLIQTLFHNQEYFRVYSSGDLIGAELGGALKNIFALASGLLRGLGFGDNANAAIMTRGLVEMQKIYDYFGAGKDSIMGLTGVGDLIVTCTSPHSRNFQAGYKIGQGKDLNETLDSMTMVVEGIRTCEAAYQLAKRENIDTPIIDAIYDIVFNRIEPDLVVQRLFSRDSKSE